jgi:hypothetical protein
MKYQLLPIGLGFVVVGAILTLGLLGLGPALVLVGILVALIDRARRHPSRSMVVLIGGPAGIIGWYSALPLGCTTTATTVGGATVGSTSCTSVVGVPSSGGWALIAGGVIGLGAGLLVTRTPAHRSERDQSSALA